MYMIQDIYSSSVFGVEIEGCHKYDTNIDSCDGETDILDKFSCYANTLIKSGTVPTIYNKSTKEVIESALFYNVNKFDNFSEGSTGKAWSYALDTSVKCSENINSIEIISPILYMMDHYFDSIGEKNELWVKLEENFRAENKYHEGLFFLFVYFTFVLNNKYNKYGVLCDGADNTAGLHVHYSNPLIFEK